ncbi:31111_t:CDS:2, partial [Racocetra persica]
NGVPTKWRRKATLQNSPKIFQKLQAREIELSKISRKCGKTRGDKVTFIAQKEIFLMWLKQYLKKGAISAQRYLDLKNEAKKDLPDEIKEALRAEMVKDISNTNRIISYPYLSPLLHRPVLFPY